MQEYELTVVLRPNLSQEDVAGAVERIKASIAQRGGEIKAEESWGTHRMAQVLQQRGQRFLEGTYQLWRFSIAPEHISPLRNQLRFAEEVLRYLVVRNERLPTPPAGRVPEPTSEKVPESVSEPTSEKVPEPVSEPTSEKVPEPVSEPTSEKVPEPASELDTVKAESQEQQER